MMKRLLIGLTCAIVLAACGGTTEGETTTTTGAETTTTAAGETTTTAAETTTTTGASEATGDLSVLQEAMAASAEATPSRIEGAITVQLPDGETAEMPMSMAVDPESGDSAMTMDFAAMAAASGEADSLPPEMAGMMGEMEVRQIGDTVYLRFPFFTAFLGAETEWVSMPAEEGSDFTDEMTSTGTPSDPSDFLESFSEAEGKVEELGTEEIRGINTTHYRLTVSENWQKALSEEEIAELEEQGPIPDASFPIDLWVGDDGLVHRMRIDIRAEDFTDTTTTEFEDFQSMSMTFDFFDFGQPVTVEPPPADQVTDMSELSGPLGTVDTQP